MTDVLLFPLGEYWTFYAGFAAFVLAMIALDLGVFHRQPHEVSVREAAIWSVVWVSLALAFNAALYAYLKSSLPERPALAGIDTDLLAETTALEFLTGYLVEKALAIDNIFVFVAVFAYFAIPLRYQHKVLFYGILGALVFRALFVSLGSVLMQYEWIVLCFGLLLMATGIKIVALPEKPLDPDGNPLVRLLRRFTPATPDLHGDRFWVRVNGRLMVTPLFVALIFIEISDVIFAVDSVPAIFALTNEPFIVFTSNIFAILGLRAMYFMLAGAVKSFQFLKYGLGIVLLFVGLKMVWLNDAFDGKFPIAWSLAIIAGIVAVSILVSIAYTRFQAGLLHRIQAAPHPDQEARLQTAPAAPGTLHRSRQ